MKWLFLVLGWLASLWDYFMSPRKQKARRMNEADEAVAKHDEAKVNKILDDGLR